MVQNEAQLLTEIVALEEETSVAVRSRFVARQQDSVFGASAFEQFSAAIDSSAIHVEAGQTEPSREPDQAASSRDFFKLSSNLDLFPNVRAESCELMEGESRADGC